MARRRKRTAKNATQRSKLSNNASHLDKSLPSLPPSDAAKHAFSPTSDSPPQSSHSNNPAEAPSLSKQVEEMRKGTLPAEARDRSPGGSRSRAGKSVLLTNHKHILTDDRSRKSHSPVYILSRVPQLGNIPKV